jgi:hypothetical protein
VWPKLFWKKWPKMFLIKVPFWKSSNIDPSLGHLT